MVGKGNGPKLDRKTVNSLLDKLSTDDDFRALFESDPESALAELGWQPSSDDDAARTSLVAAGGGACLMKAGSSLASKEAIAADRAALADSLALPFQFKPPAGLLA
jgi:putative modified peptide